MTSPCDDGTPARACVAADPKFHEIHGKLTIPIFQQGTAPYEKPADGGGITETAGVPQVARTEAVCFALTIPKASRAGGWLAAGRLSPRHRRLDAVDRHRRHCEARSPAARPRRRDWASTRSSTARAAGASTRSPDQLVFNPLNPRAARDNYPAGRGRHHPGAAGRGRRR